MPMNSQVVSYVTDRFGISSIVVPLVLATILALTVQRMRREGDERRRRQHQMQERYGRVAVVYGGCSAERAVSLVSGEAVFAALERQQVDVERVDATSDEVVTRQLRDRFDRVFIALHGGIGENGELQRQLAACGIAFTGSGASASAAALDKLRAKRLWQAHGLSTPRFLAVDAQRAQHDTHYAESVLSTLGPAVIVKPPQQGSSLGVSKACDVPSLQAALQEAARYLQQHEQQEKATEEEGAGLILVEQWVDGPEYTAALLVDHMLPVIRVEADGKSEFFDYQAKYHSHTTKYHCPSGLTPADEQALNHLALRAFRALGCTGYGRLDVMRCRHTGQFYLLEVNTVPGMTCTSLFPKAAKADGISFDELALRILDTSFIQR